MEEQVEYKTLCKKTKRVIEGLEQSLKEGTEVLKIKSMGEKIEGNLERLLELSCVIEMSEPESQEYEDVDKRGRDCVERVGKMAGVRILKQKEHHDVVSRSIRGVKRTILRTQEDLKGKVDAEKIRHLKIDQRDIINGLEEIAKELHAYQLISSTDDRSEQLITDWEALKERAEPLQDDITYLIAVYESDLTDKSEATAKVPTSSYSHHSSHPVSSHPVSSYPVLYPYPTTYTSIPMHPPGHVYAATSVRPSPMNVHAQPFPNPLSRANPYEFGTRHGASLMTTVISPAPLSYPPIFSSCSGRGGESMQSAEALADFPSSSATPCTNAYTEPYQFSVHNHPVSSHPGLSQHHNPYTSIPMYPQGHGVAHTYSVPSQHSVPPTFPFPYPKPMQTKKPSLPKFTGERHNWPEFKALWKALAEPQFASPLQLAKELKEACQGRAADRIKHIYLTGDDAYREMWKRLEAEYDDPGLAVQAVLKKLRGLKPVAEKDYAGLVRFADEVEGIMSQLKEIGQMSAIHSCDVDQLCRMLPTELCRSWNHIYMELPHVDKGQPFQRFCQFLLAERTAVARLAEWEKPKDKCNTKTHHVQGSLPGKRETDHKVRSKCVMHITQDHATENCSTFKKLTRDERHNILSKMRQCFKCLKQHPSIERKKCKADNCSLCGGDHHTLLCYSQDKQENGNSASIDADETLLKGK